MKRIITGIVITVVLVAMIVAGKLVGKIVPVAFFCAVTCIAVIEMIKALGEKIPKCFNWFLYLYAIVCTIPTAIAVFLEWNFFAVCVGTLVISLMAVCIIAVANNNKGGALQNAVFVLVYPTLPFYAFFYMNTMSSATGDVHLTAIALAVTVSAMTDVFAYAFGRMFGKRKLCPELSPNKTIEGAIGGVVGGLFAAAAIFVLIQVINLAGMRVSIEQSTLIVAYILSGILGGAANQFGDLTASLIKREVGIKDYSKVLGTHGGIMDRFDGMIMCACAVALVFTFIV